MKKRIFSIMETSKKKMGAMIICMVLLATSGAGCVFVVNANTPDQPGEQEVNKVSNKHQVEFHGMESNAGIATAKKYNILTGQTILTMTRIIMMAMVFVSAQSLPMAHIAEILSSAKHITGSFTW